MFNRQQYFCTAVANFPAVTFILIQLVASCLIAVSPLTTLFLLNLERYLCIAHPFFHRNEVTKLRMCATALVLWMLAILHSLCFRDIHGNNHAIFENFGHNYFHSSIWVYIHVYISCQSKNGKIWSVSIKLDTKEHN